MQKINLELLSICDYATISQDGKLSILGMFDQIFVTELPTQHPQFYIVGIVTGIPGTEENIVLAIKNPSGSDTIPPQKLKVAAGPNAKANIIATINNLPITEIGIFKVQLMGNTGVLGEKEFGVFRSTKQSVVQKSSSKYTN